MILEEILVYSFTLLKTIGSCSRTAKIDLFSKYALKYSFAMKDHAAGDQHQVQLPGKDSGEA